MERLADEYFRLCHDEFTGDPWLHPRVAGLGLATALLAELAFDGRITLDRGYVYVIDRTPTTDALAHTVLDQILGEGRLHTVRTWLTYLAGTAYDQVAQRLTRAQHVRPEQIRRRLKRTTVYVPIDVNRYGWPRARLSEWLRRGTPLGDADVFLAGLCRATDLHHWVLDGAPRAAFAYLDQLVTAAPALLRELLLHTQATVGDRVLSAR